MNSFPLDRALAQEIVPGATSPNIVRDREKVKPEPPDEKQEIKKKTVVTVHINGENFVLFDSSKGAHWRNKAAGYGISILDTGDVVLLAGSGGSGKACGGRLAINAHGGQLIKSGTQIEEVTATETTTEATEDGDVKPNSQKGKSDLAYAGTFSGDYRLSSTGTVHIHAKDITLDAVDNLRLVSKNNIQIQAGVGGSGDVQINAASITQRSDLIDSQSSKDTSKTKEKLDKQTDPRASINFTSPGHYQSLFKGDYIQKILGCAIIHVGGATTSIPNPDLTDRTTAFSITTLVGNMTIKAAKSMLFAVGEVSFPSALSVGSISMESQAIITATAGAKMDLSATGIATLDAKGGVTIKGDGNIDIESKGPVSLKGTFIYLN